MKNVDRLIAIRRHTRIRLVDLARLRTSLPKVRPFLITADHHPAREGLDSELLLARLAPRSVQLDLFARGLLTEAVPPGEVIWEPHDGCSLFESHEVPRFSRPMPAAPRSPEQDSAIDPAAIS